MLSIGARRLNGCDKLNGNLFRQPTLKRAGGVITEEFFSLAAYLVYLELKQLSRFFVAGSELVVISCSAS